jgi:hypothetical protein
VPRSATSRRSLRHIEALKFLEVLLGDKPALSDAESFYQRTLARDPIGAVEQPKSFMATHSLSDYCDDIGSEVSLSLLAVSLPTKADGREQLNTRSTLYTDREAKSHEFRSTIETDVPTR